MNKNKGFTLIELLVVIAIIGILASLVLVALGNARDKATDARIKSDIAQYRTLAETIYDNLGSKYDNAAPGSANGGVGVNACFSATTSNTKCAEGTANITNSAAALATDITAASGSAVTANSTQTAYCVEAKLKASGNYFCADSTGVAKIGTATAVCTSTNVKCN